MERPRNSGRRMFLYSTTGAALGIPFLESILPRHARAQAAAPIKRFVFMQSYSGQIARQWYPTATPAGYQLRDAVMSGAKADGTTYLPVRIPGTKYSIAPLQDFAATGVSNIIGTSVNKHLGKVNLLRGIDFMPRMSHSFGSYLGNYSGTNPGSYPQVPQVPTIDQVMGYSNKVYPTAPRKRVLHLGTGQPAVDCTYTNYNIAGGKIEMGTCIIDPAAAWDDVFKGFTAPVPGVTPKENPNRALVNAIHGDYARVSKNPRIGTVDKQALDRHMSFLADIERALAGVQMPPGVCTVPTRSRSIDGIPYKSGVNVLDLRDSVPLLIDVAVAALMCDLTRVVTFNINKACYTDAGGTLRGSYHESAGVAGDWHDFAHSIPGDAVKTANFNAISKWISANLFNAFLDRLDVAENNGKTYLDNSLVVWGNEVGYGHSEKDVQTITGGSAGGFLKTGNYVDYIDWTQGIVKTEAGFGVMVPGIPHNRWLVTMLQAMGLKPADYEMGGQPGYGYSKLVDPPTANWPAAVASEIGLPLPGILA